MATRKMLTIATAMLLCLTVGFSAAGQGVAIVCDATENVPQCVNRALGSYTQPGAPTAAGAVAGTDFGRNFSSGFTNFLKVFGTEFDMLNVREATTDVSAQYAIELWGGRSALVQASIQRPVLAKDVQDAAARATVAVADLTGQLGDFSDVQLGVTMELIGAQRDLGRDVESLIFYMYSKQKQNLDDDVNRLQRECGLDKTFADCPNIKTMVEQRLRNLDRSEFAAIARGFARQFETLSQLTFTGSSMIRDPLVGRNEVDIALTWEQLFGGHSLQSACRKPGKPVTAIDNAKCEALKAELLEAGQRTRADDPVGRLSVGATWSYKWPDSTAVAAVPIERPRAYSFSLVAKWNKILLRTVDAAAQPLLRLDAGVTVDIVRKDGEQSTRRTVATGTFSVRLSDSVTLPIGVQYASAPADLANVDVKWSAHTGVNFRLPDATGK